MHEAYVTTKRPGKIKVTGDDRQVRIDLPAPTKELSLTANEARLLGGVLVEASCKPHDPKDY